MRPFSKYTKNDVYALFTMLVNKVFVYFENGLRKETEILVKGILDLSFLFYH